MLRQIKASLAAILILSLALQASPIEDYFTQDELDTIRDAQELPLRVPAYFKLAERRLIVLGLMGKSEKTKERERKELEEYEKAKKKAGDKASSVKKPVDELAYLEEFTHSELLRGYIQALDELMNNIDDAYSRRLDIRDALEELDKFARETMPRIEKFQPKNENEKLALEDALTKAREAHEGAKEALELVPKTEKKKK